MILFLLICLATIVPQQQKPLIIDGMIYISPIYLHAFNEEQFNEVKSGFGYQYQVSKDKRISLSFWGDGHHYAVSANNYLNSLGFNCNKKVIENPGFNGFYFKIRKIESYEIFAMVSVMDLNIDNEDTMEYREAWLNLRGNDMDEFDITTHLAFMQDGKWIFNIIIGRNERYFNLNEEIKTIEQLLESIEIK